MKTIALVLRKIAQWLDPQPIMIEMLLLDAPVESPNKVRGIPTMFWKIGNNAIGFYPVPERDFDMVVKL